MRAVSPITPPPRLLAVLALACLTFGCATPKRNAVPRDLVETASVPGFPQARIWGDQDPAFKHSVFCMTREELRQKCPSTVGREHHYLALSGGGPSGAFGAGLLSGWTEKGDRPEFTLVTGISAGGLIAPFAFLGPDYDATLRKLFTHYSTRDVIRRRNVFRILFSDAATSSWPLRNVLFDAVVEAIAAEHRKARMLIVGTTNFDAVRPVCHLPVDLAADTR